ncbi:type II secretion system secretin GspD [Pseudomonas gingeri]|jgi:general secretion pathway protein D|uniref:Type II secretion system secretin GspD n=2 Tax=Pseudomonas TaxID=286 RepID=A0A7Y7WFT8_9PSED|nr:type II secretion system secretin GspD [Pseudomonas gingeri]NWB48143.1 type II secretion system secretin GspD [Pseudomonas gingeri]
MNRSFKSARRCLTFLSLVASLLLAPGLRADEPQWQLAMNDAELRDVVREMSSILGTTVVLDPRVQGRITVLSEQALDREGVRRLFYSVLDAHNFTVIDEGDRILIAPVADARTRASSVNSANALGGQFVTEVVALGSSVAADIAGLVRPLVSVNGYVGPSASANALVITDSAANVRRIAKIVRQLDLGQKNAHDVIQLRHGLANELARMMEQSLGRQGAESGSQVIADSRNNRLVIIGTQDVRRRLMDLARSLDTPAASVADNARVIRLRHSDAKQLAEVLDAMGQGLGQEAGAAANRDATTAKALVKADESQNALVLIAEPSQIRTLENIVRQLDQPRSQVLIHAAIVEISGDINEALGVQWGGKSGSIEGGITFAGANITLPKLSGSNATLPDGAVLRVGNDRFGMLVSALASNTRNNVLSTPSLLTLDNQEAEILVGQNVPFKSGSYQPSDDGNGKPYNTVTRHDIGIKLKIRPHINEGSTLRLQVEQENSELAKSAEITDDLITNKRALKSTILADDGEIIVIGGLIKDSVRVQESGVPLLRDIPYLGALFRWNSERHEKTNLMVFLRPTIVRSKEDISEVSEQRYNSLRQLSQPAAGKSNSLLLPREARQLFDGDDAEPAIDLRRQKVGAP